jgi:tRNA (mo5U34)-methyltransferase
MPEWEETLRRLPEIDPLDIELATEVSIGDASLMDKGRRLALQATLMGLHPWRKGPYNLFGLPVNTEWRSDWKWDRVAPHLDSLENRLILDVGCGNGYHCWRMLGAGARRVIGIDPSAKFVFQFQAIKNFAGAGLPIDVLPLGIEHMPTQLAAFDTVFSMGILYHRRSPMDHLRELKELLRPGGQLVLETLVIEGPQGMTLVPEGRYAKMPNVWYLPTVDTLLSWMRKNGLKNPRLVDLSTTSIEEQRSTDWMTFESLQDFLDPNDHSKTVEGHPAPIRAVILAEAP